MLPTLFRTPRLLLRPMVPDDAPSYYELNADPEVRRYTFDPAQESVEAARVFLEGYQKIYRDDGFARWAVIEEATGEFLGWCGLRKQPDGEVDVGYRYRRIFWGRGFATEAARASLAYGFEVLKLPRIIGLAHVDNAKSIRVLGKIGLRYEREATFAERPAVLYALSREEWPSATNP